MLFCIALNRYLVKKISKYFSFKIWVFFLYLYRELIFKRKSVQSLKMAIRCFISKRIWIINKVCTISAYKYLHIQSLSEIVEGIIRIQYKLEMSVSSASIYPLPLVCICTCMIFDLPKSSNSKFIEDTKYVSFLQSYKVP